jgi:hypothetical protein
MSAKSPAEVKAVPRWILIPLLMSLVLHLFLGGALPYYLAPGYRFIEKEITKRYQPARVRSARPVHMSGARHVSAIKAPTEEPSEVDINAVVEQFSNAIKDVPSATSESGADPAAQSPLVRRKWEDEHYRVIVRQGRPEIPTDTSGVGSPYGHHLVFEDHVERVVYPSGGTRGAAGGAASAAVDKLVESLVKASFAPELDLTPKVVTQTDAVLTVQKGELEAGHRIPLLPDAHAMGKSIADDVREAKILEPERPASDDSFAGVTPLEPYVQTEFRVYREPGDPKSFFRLVIKAREGADLPVIRKNVLFVTDISLSIPPEELDEARKAVRTYLTQLDPGDKLNVVRFSEEARGAFDGFVPPTPENIEKALEFVQKVPGQIKTDVYLVLHSIILNIYSKFDPCHVFLISDGKSTQGIRDTQRIVRDISPVIRSNISIFAVDIGKGGNRYMLDLVAYRSRGELLKIDDLSLVESELVQFATLRDNPILMNLSVNYANLKVDEVYPQILPNLYRKKGVVIYGQCEPGRKCAIQIYGQAAGGKWKRFLYPINVPEESDGDASIAREWARGKIHYLVAKMAREGQSQEVINEIIQLGQKYNLPVPAQNE